MLQARGTWIQAARIAALLTAACVARSPLARAGSFTPTGAGGSVSVYHAPPPAQPAAGGPPVPAPANSAQAARPAGTAEDASAELERIRAEQQKSWGAINNLNPFSANAGKAPTGAVGAAGGDPGAALSGPFQQLAQVLSNPAVQGYLKLFNNPVFARGADQLVQAFKGPKRMTLVYAELGFILFVLILRAWRFSKSTHWVKRLWTQLWTFLLFWAGLLVVIPWAVLGDSYYNTVAGLLDVLLTSLKK